MANKRDQILMATRDLVFEQGLQDISMSQIAERAEVGMGTIYNYFVSKEVMVFVLYDGIKKAMSDYALHGYEEDQPVVSRYLHFLRRYAHYGLEHPREFGLTEQLSQVPFVQSQANVYPSTTHIFQLLTEARQQNLIKDMPDNVLVVLTFGALSKLVEAHTKGEVQLNNSLIEQVVLACWDAIKS